MMNARLVAALVLIVVATASAQENRRARFYNFGGPALSGLKQWRDFKQIHPHMADRTLVVTASTSAPVAKLSPSVPLNTPSKLFQTEAWFPRRPTPTKISFPDLNGLYEVQLYFAEIISGLMGVGKRVFDIVLNGETRYSNLDVFAEVGGLTGMVKSFVVNCTAGLDIVLRHVTENPNVKGIALVPLCETCKGLKNCAIPNTVESCSLGGKCRPKYFYNAGGPLLKGLNTWSWSGKLPNTGNPSAFGTYTISAPINLMHPSLPPNTPASLFQTELWFKPGTGEQVIPITGLDGLYEVQLYFAEIFGPTKAVGKRVFDIVLNGVTRYSNLDVFAEAGANTGLMKSFVVECSAGLQISLHHVVENPALKGIGLIPVCTDCAAVRKCSKDAVHPTDVDLKIDFGGEGDGDSWLPSIGELVVSAPWYQVEALAPVDASRSSLPVRVPDSLFRTAVETRARDLVLRVPLQPATYVVTLLFAEIGNAASIFDIKMEGVMVATNFAVLTSRSSPKAKFASYRVAVDDEALDIALIFKTVAFLRGNPLLSGLHIREYVPEHATETLLHVVIDSSPVVIDHDSSGSEVAEFKGATSHTHEEGQSITGFSWTVDGEEFSKSSAATVILPVGTHRVGLEISDSKSPPESLSESVQVTVAPTNAVPGVIVKCYNDAPFFRVSGSPEASYFSVTASLANTGRPSGKIYRILTRLHVSETASYSIVPKGGESSFVLLQGIWLRGRTLSLAPAVYDLDVRFRVTDGTQWPLEILRKKNGGVARPFDLDEITYDMTMESPFVTDINPKQGFSGGGEKIILDGTAFTGSQIIVSWGGTTVKKAAITVSGDGTQLIFFAPPSPAGIIKVSVVADGKKSGEVEFLSIVGGPIPINFQDAMKLVQFPWSKMPTRATWAPDGRLFVSMVDGSLKALTLNEDYEITDTQDFVGVFGTYEKSILGIAFNPVQNGPDALYIAHSKLFASGGKCLPPGPAPYPGNVSMLLAPDFDTPIPVITGLPVSNHDHGINGMDFDTEGNLYFS